MQVQLTASCDACESVSGTLTSSKRMMSRLDEAWIMKHVSFSFDKRSEVL